MVDFEKCGHKVHGKDDAGAEIVMVHDYMTPIRHLYSPPALGDEASGIPLFSGVFHLDGREWVGHIKFDMRKHPESLASGYRAYESISNIDIKGLEAFLGFGPRWIEATALVLPGVETVPEPPTDSGDVERPAFADPAAGEWIFGQVIGPAQVGDGSHVSAVTFLVPNGWQVSDGLPVCGDRRTLWGATVVEADGWSIRLEPRPDISTLKVREHQRSTNAHVLTHVGEIRRADGSPFASAEAEKVFEVLGLAMTLFTGRNTACVLPVGWASGKAVWSEWGQTRPIRRRESSLDWFDIVGGSASLGELIRCCFGAAHDSVLWAVVSLAAGYLLSAHTSTVQMRVSLPVAAIQLLADNWFTSLAEPEDRKSNGVMDDMGAARKYRLFLNAMRLSPAVPPHLEHLVRLQEHIAGTQRSQPEDGSIASDTVGSSSLEPVDAVKCIIALRNKVEHPKKNSRENIPIQQWAEAGFFATDSLLLGILFMLGYNGTYLGLSANRRGAGSGTPVPWAAPQEPTTADPLLSE